MVDRAVAAVSARPALDADTRAAIADAWRALWVSRLLVWVAGAGSVLAFGLSARADDFDPAGITRPGTSLGDALLAPMARWDSTWFVNIANDGYGDGQREAFFPLYPIVVKVAGAPFGEPVIAGALASTALLLVALVLLHRLVAMDHGRAVARNAVLVTAFGPMAFFFSAVYSESLFLALSVGAVLMARREQWMWAGALGALAASTRSAGILLLVPLLLIYLWDVGRPGRDRMRTPGPEVLWLGLVPLGLAAFCLALAADGQDMLAPFDAQEVWFREFAGPFVGAWDGADAALQGARQLLSGSSTPVYFTEAGGDPMVVARHNLELFAWLLIGVTLTVGTLRRLPAAYGAYVLVALALPLSYPVGPQPLMSLPRFLLVLFPLGIVLALWMTGRVWRERLVLAACAIGLAVYSGIFSTWHWVA